MGKATAGLVDFLKARLDEDEAAAKPIEHSWVTAAEPLTAVFSHRFDAKRMLREVEAKRDILALYEAASEFNDKSLGVATLRTVIRDLAAVYSDHPDYRQEWGPSGG